MKISRAGLLGALLVLLVAAVCIRLGFWQLDRLEQRRARNAAVLGALALPTLELRGDSLEAVLRDPERFRFRRVRARGTLLASAEVVVRGRSLQGRPGVHLLTPLHLEGTDRAVLVNRGWAASPDAANLDPRPLAESGVREVEGIVHLVPPADGLEVRPLTRQLDGRSVLSVQRVTPELLRGHGPVPLLPVVLQQLPDSAASPPAGLTRLPPPELGEGSHLSYAVQWFSFAAIALIGFLVLLLRSRRAPR